MALMGRSGASPSPTSTANSVRLAPAYAAPPPRNGITAAERTALAGFLGDDSLPVEIDVAAVRAVLAERMARVREQVPALRRHQVVRDLSVVARADGRTSAAEKAVLVEIATGIGLPASVVATALAQAERGLD